MDEGFPPGAAAIYFVSLIVRYSWTYTNSYSVHVPLHFCDCDHCLLLIMIRLLQSSGNVEEWPSGRLVKHTVFVKETRFAPVLNLSREFLTFFPVSFAERQPLPLLLYFHGQSGEAQADALSSKYNTISEQAGFSAAYLQGIGDSDGGCGTGWNVGPSAHK